MNARPMTVAQFAQRIAWEGGIIGALGYGLLPEDVDDPELASLWSELCDHYAAMMPLASQVAIILRRARSDDEGHAK